MANARKIVAAIMAATALATTAMSGISASASYKDDELTYFSVSGYSERSTKVREKDDSTSASIKIVSTNPSGCKATVKVYGNYSQSTSGGVNKTAGTPKVVGASSYYTYLPNYVWEHMKKDSSGHVHDHIYAYLTLRTYSNPQAKPDFSIVKGYWSPDSI